MSFGFSKYWTYAIGKFDFGSVVFQVPLERHVHCMEKLTNRAWASRGFGRGVRAVTSPQCHSRLSRMQCHCVIHLKEHLSLEVK